MPRPKRASAIKAGEVMKEEIKRIMEKEAAGGGVPDAKKAKAGVAGAEGVSTKEGKQPAEAGASATGGQPDEDGPGLADLLRPDLESESEGEDGTFVAGEEPEDEAELGEDGEELGEEPAANDGAGAAAPSAS